MSKAATQASIKAASKSALKTDSKPKSQNLSRESKPLGILGGGQLARMLALRAHEMGIPVAVLSESESDPAAQVTNLWTKGKLSDRATLKAFLKKCRLATFESEFLDAELLEKLEQETGTQIFPKPSDMRLIQDRLSQKTMLIENKLPTAAFIAVKTAAEARAAFATLGKKVVFKKRRFGYDGYGTFVIKSDAELEKFAKGLSQIPGHEYGFIAEKFIPFKREIAIMVARSANKTTVALPFVETFQEDSRCLWVKGPLQASKAQSKTLKAIVKKLEDFLSEIEYVGIMGVELFDTGKDFVINELAPRVHNSGHYSQDALFEDQFVLHLKSILGCVITKPKLNAPGFAMYNLIGHSKEAPAWHLTSDVKLHWYGKNENRPGRKMGHLNATAKTPNEALKLLEKRVKKNFEV